MYNFCTPHVRDGLARLLVFFGLTRRSSGVARQPSFVEREFRRESQLGYADQYYGDTVLFVDPGGLTEDARHWISAASVNTVRLADLNSARRVITGGVGGVALVVIDLDSCGGIARIVHDLIAFRLENYDIPLIMVSSETTGDDYSTERLALADVTLRAPVSVSRFDLALSEAMTNNIDWQVRVTHQMATVAMELASAGS